jgi:GT2 family glycosyltransferase/glycosyltransferase involved in cell wall biosynthesis
MKDINIAFITERMIRGHGVDLVVDRLADGLAKKGYHTHVYCNYFDETFTHRKSYCIEKLHYFKPAANPIIYEQRVRRLIPYLNSKQVSLFIIQSFPFYSLIPGLDSPVLAVDHGIVSVEDMPLKRKLKYRYINFSQNVSYFKKAEGLVTVSKYLLGCLPLKLRKNASYIYNGADHYKKSSPESSQFEDFRKSIGISRDDVLLLYVGRLNLTNQPYKGLAELVSIYQKIYQKHKNVRLMTVGYGSINDEEYLKNQGILAVGNAPEDMMPLIYGACDIYTTASKWEGFDLPVVEAQGFGKPSVIYNIGAHPEVSKDGETGYIVKDCREFKEKLEVLILNPDLREKMGKNAEKHSKEFTWKNSVNNYDGLIKKMLSLEDEDIKPKPDINRYRPLKSKNVSAVIINYNSSYQVLKECLDSLKQQSHKNMEIIIFDNNSFNKEILDDIKVEFPEINIIYSDRNLGPGEGLNRAIEQASSELILISNFDVLYNFDAVEQMVSLFNNIESSYIGLAPKIKFYFQKDFIDSVGTGIDRNFYVNHYGRGQLDLSQYNKEEDIFGVSFASCMIRKEAFLKNMVGPIDPSFFLFYEDVDFCYRANLHGYRFRSCPQSILYHRFGYNFRDEATAFQRKYYYQKLNIMKTAYKNAETDNMNRIIKNELDIQKQNLGDPNLKSVAKRIISDFKKSTGKLKKQRTFMQFSRQLPDSDIIRYSWSEKDYFDVVRNEPEYSIPNLLYSYRRLFALMGNEKYEGIVNYLRTLENTKFITESRLFRDILHGKLEYEQPSVHRFIDRLS